jgi:hypothetical protein
LSPAINGRASSLRILGSVISRYCVATDSHDLPEENSTLGQAGMSEGRFD